MKTYQSVRQCYSNFFNELRIPYLVVDADSGNMGGKLSHEYHLLSKVGEDRVVICGNCNYQANHEIASSPIQVSDVTVTQTEGSLGPSGIDGQSPASSGEEETFNSSDNQMSMWSGVTGDKTTLINVFYPLAPTKHGQGLGGHKEVSISAVKALIPSLDAGEESPIPKWESNFGITNISGQDSPKDQPRIVNLYDCRLLLTTPLESLSANAERLFPQGLSPERVAQSQVSHIHLHPMTHEPFNLLQISDGDSCPRCHERLLTVQKAIELGHTFFLGDRYSQVLQAFVDAEGTSEQAVSDSGQSTGTRTTRLPLQMGCYGIGVSRIMGAVAELLADEIGLNWPRAIAPYEVDIVPREGNEEDAIIVYDALIESRLSQREEGGSNGDTRRLDVVVDDRPRDFIWKLKDADLVGFPVVVILGRAWTSQRKCEVQCRRLANLRQEVSLEELPTFVHSLLDQL